MVREHHQLNGHECEQTPGDSGGQRSLAAHGVKNSWTDSESEQLGVRHCHTTGYIALMRVTLTIGDHQRRKPGNIRENLKD